MKLTVENVDKVVVDCLAGVISEDMVVCQGIMRDFGFNKDKLEKNRENICSMLRQLPEKFKVGASFLEAYETKDGVMWGSHARMEALFCLGIGVGKVKCLLPREMWDAVGGVPYYQVLE